MKWTKNFKILYTSWWIIFLGSIQLTDFQDYKTKGFLLNLSTELANVVGWPWLADKHTPTHSLATLPGATGRKQKEGERTHGLS